MTLILSGTDGLSDVDGSAATPAIRGTDANTGIFFPAADTIAFSEGGVESMRIDASGNVGIGVTPSAWGSSKGLQVGTLTSLADISGISVFGCNYYYNGTNNIAIGTSAASRYYQTSGEHYWQTAGAGSAGRTLSFTTAMTLDASGNVGVGVTPSAWNSAYKALEIGNSFGIIGGSLSADLYYNAFLNSGGNFIYKATTSASAYSLAAGQHRWYTAPSGTAGNTISFTQAMTLDSSGNLLVNNTSGSVSGPGTGQAVIACSTSGKFALSMTNTNASGAYGLGISSQTGENIYLYYQGTYKGLVSTSAGGTTYGTISDYRLKEKVQPMIGALEAVAQLKPCTYTWKEDGLFGQGFIAHELAEVCPQAVVGEKDAIETYTDEDGNEQTRPKYQSIDTSFLVATLTAAIQELKVLVDTQANTITTLTDRITALETPTGTQA
jgi:hypothetical protein